MEFSIQIWNVTPIQTVNITRVEVQKRLIVQLEAAIVKVCFSLITKYIFFLEQMQKIMWNAISEKSKLIFVELEPSACFLFENTKSMPHDVSIEFGLILEDNTNMILMSILSTI